MNIIKFTANEQANAYDIDMQLRKYFGLYELKYNEDAQQGEIQCRPSVDILPDLCFSDCDWLETVEILDGFVEGGYGVFRNCANLKMVSFPDSMKAVPEGCCEGCESLKNIKFSKNIKEIGIFAFRGCKKLKSINIPESVSYIGDGSFLGCTALTTLKFSSNVVYIGEGAFTGCDELVDFDVPSGFVDIIMKGSEYDSREDEDYEDEDDSYSGPDFEIKDGVLVKYHGNDKNVIIPDGVTDLGRLSFNECECIETVKIPGTVEYIALGAFYDARNLKSIIIPNSVK